MISTIDAVYLFAGYDQGSTKAIHKFQNMQWTSSVGQLQYLTHNRNVFQIGNDFLILGSAGGW